MVRLQLAIAAGYIRILIPIMRRPREPPQHHIDQAEKNGADKRRAEAAHMKSGREQGRCQFKHESVDDKPEKPQREKRERKGQNLEQKADCCVDEPNDERGDERGKRPTDVNSGHDTGHDPNRYGAQYPIQ